MRGQQKMIRNSSRIVAAAGAAMLLAPVLSAEAATVLVTGTLSDKVMSYDVTGKTWTLNGTFADNATSLGGGAALDAPAPLGVAASHVYVGEQKAGGRILKFTSGGSFVGVVATEGVDFTGNPDAITTGPDGNLYMSVAFGTNSDRIYKLDVATNLVSTFVAPTGTSAAGTYTFNNPRGITFDNAGTLYVADRQGGQIRTFDSTGMYTGNLASGVTEANSVSYDAANDRLLVGSRSGATGFPGLVLGFNTAANGGTFIGELNRNAGNGYLDVENIGGEIFFTHFGTDVIRVVDSPTATTIVASGTDIDGVSHMQVVIPEPAGLALLGLGGIAAWARRRRSA